MDLFVSPYELGKLGKLAGATNWDGLLFATLQFVIPLVVANVSLVSKQLQSMQYCVSTSVPQQSPSSKQHSITFAESSQNPSPNHVV